MSKLMTLAQINESSADDQANIYFEKFADQMSVYESMSAKSRINESISAYEIIALGQQLDQYQNYERFCESQGNLGSLGAIPQVALDVITAAVGSSILPLLASIQPMAEEHGIVYYKEISAQQTGNGYTSGDIISSPLQRDDTGDGTLGSNRKMVTLATGDGSTNPLTGTTLTNLRPYRVEISIAGVGNGKDDGKGKILGFGFSGTINYVTGVFSITGAAAIPNAVPVLAIVDLDVDSQTSIDQVQAGLATKDIRAQIWALRSDVGAFANFAFSNRFGRSAIDEVATDLTNELTRVLNTNAINVLYTNLPGSGYTTWDRYITGISYAENKLTFVDAIASAEAQIHAQSGAPTANRYIAGKVAAAAMRGMPDFKIAPDAAAVSVGLYGFYDGVPVIRATGVVPDAEIVVLSNSGNYFNAPMAYAPFMPLLVTSTVQSPSNPFKQTTAAGIWSGMTALNGNLSTKITVDSTP